VPQLRHLEETSCTAWQGLIGIPALLGVAWLASERRADVSWRLVASGLALQFVVALVLLRFKPVKVAFEALNHVVLAVQAATLKGTAFVFGYLGGGPAPFEITDPHNTFIPAVQEIC
jgi:CNT family concentrative nucleoside transporter